MKFSLALAVAAAATVVSAETNAKRFALGLGPKSPVAKREPTVAAPARRSKPSSGPGQCNTGAAQCCASSGKAGQDDTIDTLLDHLGLKHHVAHGTMCGATCSPMGVGVGNSATCNQEPLCCDDNSFQGLINIGCTPITIGL